MQTFALFIFLIAKMCRCVLREGLNLFWCAPTASSLEPLRKTFPVGNKVEGLLGFRQVGAV